MRCRLCKKELPEGSKFCMSCGTAVKQQEIQTKDFFFSALSYNQGVKEKINKWLSENKGIVLKAISIDTFMNCNLPIKWETVPSGVKIKYVTTGTAAPYYFEYFKSMHLFGHSFQRVERRLEQWKDENPDKQIIWSQKAGHQRDNGSTQSIYIIYQ